MRRTASDLKIRLSRSENTSSPLALVLMSPTVIGPVCRQAIDELDGSTNQFPLDSRSIRPRLNRVMWQLTPLPSGPALPRPRSCFPSSRSGTGRRLQRQPETSWLEQQDSPRSGGARPNSSAFVDGYHHLAQCHWPDRHYVLCIKLDQPKSFWRCCAMRATSTLASSRSHPPQLGRRGPS